MCGLHRINIRTLIIWTYLFELVANKLECLIDGIRMSCDSYNALRARSVADVDLGPTLQIAKERMKQCTMICLLFSDYAVLRSNLNQIGSSQPVLKLF